MSQCNCIIVSVGSGLYSSILFVALCIKKGLAEPYSSINQNLNATLDHSQSANRTARDNLLGLSKWKGCRLSHRRNDCFISGSLSLSRRLQRVQVASILPHKRHAKRLLSAVYMGCAILPFCKPRVAWYARLCKQR